MLRWRQSLCPSPADRVMPGHAPHGTIAQLLFACMGVNHHLVGPCRPDKQQGLRNNPDSDDILRVLKGSAVMGNARNNNGMAPFEGRATKRADGKIGAWRFVRTIRTCARHRHRESFGRRLLPVNVWGSRKIVGISGCIVSTQGGYSNPETLPCVSLVRCGADSCMAWSPCNVGYPRSNVDVHRVCGRSSA